MSRDPITTHTGNTITYAGSTRANSRIGWGYFVQNHRSTLTAQNEWFYDKSSQKLTIYSTTIPADVKMTTRDQLVDLDQRDATNDYIAIQNIDFEGANVAAIGGRQIYPKNGITITGCTIANSGRDAIYLSNAQNCTVAFCTIINTWNNAIFFENEGGWSENAIIEHNTIRMTGTVPGMGYQNEGIAYRGISILGGQASIQYNVVDDTGYNGISFYRDKSVVKYNRVDRFCSVIDDGASIYTHTGYNTKTEPHHTEREVIGNTVLNGIGASPGTDGETLVHGIYLDDGTTGVVVKDNTVYNTNYGGIYIHNAQNITITNNMVYACLAMQLLIVHDFRPLPDDTAPIRNLVLRNNILIAKAATAEVMHIRSWGYDPDGAGPLPWVVDDVGLFTARSGDIDNNYSRYALDSPV